MRVACALHRFVKPISLVQAIIENNPWNDPSGYIANMGIFYHNTNSPGPARGV
jgi:hypothetical protein